MRILSPVTQVKKHLSVVYELVMGALALAVLVVLIIEFTRPLTAAQSLLLTRIDLSILSIFAADYFYRLYQSNDKVAFFRSNLFDLVAIMPFDKAFRIARLARLTRLARLSRATRFVRVLIFVRKFTVNLKGILKTNGLQYILLFTAILVFLGAISIYSLEPSMETFGDAVWWSLVTATTVGYGDISPESAGGRMIAAILMLVGIGMIGMVTGSIATYFVSKLTVEEPRTGLIDQQIDLAKNKLDEIEKLSECDISALNAMIYQIWKYKKEKNTLERQISQ